MNLIEIVPPGSREHRRRIREMTSDPWLKWRMPMNPIKAALLEMATGAVAGLMMAAVLRLLVWWLTGI